MGKKIFITLLICELVICALKSQDVYPIRGTVYIRDGKATRINLIIYSNNKEKKIPVDIDGNFVTYLPWGGDYEFYFSKPGYVSKRIKFSTVIPNEIAKSNIYPYDLQVELFPMFPNADTTFFKNPVAKISYSDTYGDFDYDLNYQLFVRDKINTLKSQYNSWLSKSRNSLNENKREEAKKQEMTVLQYQKAVEISKKKINTTPETIKRKPISKPLKNNDPFGLPPLREKYPNGKSIEIHELKGKVITRVIMKNGRYQKVFYRVKHNWGGLFYFVKESPTYYRSISKYNFDKSTKI